MGSLAERALCKVFTARLLVFGKHDGTSCDECSELKAMSKVVLR